MASYLVTVYVEDIASVITLFDNVRIYRSTTGNEADRSLYDSFPLVAGQATYEWTDANGLASYVVWFTYYNSSSFAESGYSEPIQYGTGAESYVPGFSFTGATYPVEFSLSNEENTIVNNIRYFIGDSKKVRRDYVSPACNLGYENVSDDRYTYQLQERGWPLKVVLDGDELTTLHHPYVADYNYLTFSGTTISTTSGVVDVWYESFRHSDREILKVYDSVAPPVYISSVYASEEIMTLSAAVLLIETEIAALMGETSGSFTLHGELSYNPEPLLKQKRAFLKDLKDKLEELVGETTSAIIEGVRVD